MGNYRSKAPFYSPDDSLPQKIYAGILGKIIGVYMGRPFEGWPYEKVKDKLGYVDTFTAEQFGLPLIVADDDISGTFVFLRALRENGCSTSLSSEQIGTTWLNQLVENKTVLWWGGVGMSSEHTAYVNLKRGLKAPSSGSCTTNGTIISEQIGAQIFIDGWALVSPNNPEQAVKFARAAGSVSHDGEAVHAASFIAAVEAMAFGESRLDILFRKGLDYIPGDSKVAELIRFVQHLHSGTDDWEKAFLELRERYNYQIYKGCCHVMPNLGIVLLALLYGGESFQESQKIANTLGWDTDCNAANVGCINGIRLGLEALTRDFDYREAVADRMYLTSAESGAALSDAVTETHEVLDVISKLNGTEYRKPKDGARFHFSLPGSLQGFFSDDPRVRFSNEAGQLQIDIDNLDSTPVRIAAPVFFQEDALEYRHAYTPTGSPILHSGQTIRYRFHLADDVQVRPFIETYAPEKTILYGDYNAESWMIPDTCSNPIHRLGFEFSTSETLHTAAALLDFIDITGGPRLSYDSKNKCGPYFAKDWVASEPLTADPWILGLGGLTVAVSNDGPGLLYTGGYKWSSYEIETEILSDLCEYFGLAFRIRGLLNYFACVIFPGEQVCRVMKKRNGIDTVLEEIPYSEAPPGESLPFKVIVKGNRLKVRIKTADLFDIELPNTDGFLTTGGIGFAVSRGSLRSSYLRINGIEEEP